MWNKALPITSVPTEEEIELTFDNMTTATDGCEIEPGEVCRHGYGSWLVKLDFD